MAIVLLNGTVDKAAMSARKSVSISLSQELHASAEKLLASGRYGNFSEVVRAGLRLLEEREVGFQSYQAAKGGVEVTK